MEEENKVNKLISALSIIYSINTDKIVRNEAQKYLDNIKKEPESWKYGIELASIKNVKMDVLRHFGLNLIDQGICCNWEKYEDEDKVYLRNCMINMCYNGVRDGTSEDQEEVHYIKQKISKILFEIVKKDWIFILQDMDITFKNMFLTSPTARYISLNTILNLIENAFQSTDDKEVSKIPIFSVAMISILCSSNILKTIYPNGLPYSLKIPENNSGWIDIFEKSIKSYFGVIDTSCFPKINEIEIIHVLNCLKGCLSWIPTESILESGILNQLCFVLSQGNIEIKMISSDCLHALFIRPLLPDDKLSEIVYTFFEPDNLNHLRIITEEIFSQVQYNGYNDFDEKKYSFLKKIVETIVALGTFHIINYKRSNTLVYFNIYLDFVLFTTKHPSLIVSSISQPFWIALLKSPLNKENTVISILPRLLDLISSRLIRYENAQTVLKDSIEIKFLNHDIETTSEIHIFCENYRRFMVDLIRIIFSMPTKDCLLYAQQHIEKFFKKCPDFMTDQIFFHKKKTLDYHFYDSNYTFIEAVLKGYKILNEKDQHLDDDLKNNFLSLLIYWFEKIIHIDVKAPLILSRQIQVLVMFLYSLEKKEFLIPVLEKIISTLVYRYHDNISDEAVQTIHDLRGKCSHELLKLAMELSDSLWNIYPQLEKIVYEIINEKSSENENTVFITFLLIISQKPNNTQNEKTYYFQLITTKLIDTWNKTKSLFNLSTFNGFLDLLGLQKIMQYIQSKNIHSIQDLNTKYLDVEGKQLIDELKETRKLIWPIQGFRKFADYHLKIMLLQDNNYDYISKLWKPVVEFILPDIFNIIKHIHALYDPDNWNSFVPELQFIISQSISERFWFHGINSTSKDEFYEEISKFKDKIIELSYNLSHFLRKNREHCYINIGLFSSFGDSFYRIPNLSQNIIESFFTNTKGLSLYVWSSILDFSISPIITKCPPQYQDCFLKILLPYLFVEIDKKLVFEWSQISEKEFISDNNLNTPFCQDKDLSNEMINESLLRNLSLVVVKMLTELLVPSSDKSQFTKNTSNSKTSNMLYILKNEDILKSLFPLLSHLIMFHDTRTCNNTVRIFQNIIPILMDDSNVHVCAFIANDLFKACLMAINDTYLASVHSEIIQILTQIYTLAHEKGFQQSKEVLLSISILNLEKINEFEAKLFNVKNSKSKRAIMMDFLSTSGIKPEIDAGKSSKKTINDINTYKIIKHFKSDMKSSNEDIFQQENIEISNLFE
ncbi:hypothetical protein T552_01207 [Pneumocystis carinii B80]|uniref:Exportin-5 C-terminal domain-containing protein n=1 Tax=Pneumocystis carinii (strain B80) TaxID=1408658 RepID=A0A0W4ZLM6_PNEC8|nr:hypothetical protein T552_01207 [Pneumocystis carinii B80]KTW29252.1 hypothetical protein T552_01207 [Pneumocystis carinii B80]